MKALFKNKIISKENIIVRSSMFKNTLIGSDKNNWYPMLRKNSFDTKLPGTICQNAKWIQLLPLMLYSDLKKNQSFFKTKEWKLFLLLKSLCEYLLAPQKSEHQIKIQTQMLHNYMKIRLSLINDEDVGPLSPKHLFGFEYEEIEREVGCLSHLHTNRFEVCSCPCLVL